MVSNKRRQVKYDYIAVRVEAAQAFKTCRDPDETKTDTLMKLIKTYKESKMNRKSPVQVDPGINQSQAENA